MRRPTTTEKEERQRKIKKTPREKRNCERLCSENYRELWKIFRRTENIYNIICCVVYSVFHLLNMYTLCFSFSLLIRPGSASFICFDILSSSDFGVGIHAHRSERAGDVANFDILDSRDQDIATVIANKRTSQATNGETGTGKNA